MYKTEKKYWRNGWYKPFNFWAYSFTIGNIGFMICKPSADVPLISIYKLTR